MPGDYGGWKWERVKIQRDHHQALKDNGPRDWTVPLCVRCHQIKTRIETAERKGKPVDQKEIAELRKIAEGMTKREAARHRGGGKRKGPPSSPAWHTWARTGVGAAIILAALWLLQNPGAVPTVDGGMPDWGALTRILLVVALLAAAANGALLLIRWRLRRHKAALLRLGDAIARETNTNPRLIKIRVRRWRRGVPVNASCRYASVFDDSTGAPGRDKVEAKISEKIGRPLTFRWLPSRDTISWAPRDDVSPGEPAMPSDDTPLPAPPPSRESVLSRLGGGISAALGAEADVEVTRWHERNVPAAFRVTYPASARVHEDKVQDAVEDKVTALLPGTWRAEWRTAADEVVFTDTPDPLAPVVPPPALPASIDLRSLPCGRRDDGKPWTVPLATHVLIGGASGAGKGSVLWSMIRALSPGVAEGKVRLWAIDPKGGMELGRGRQAFEKFATDSNDAQALLDSAVVFMKRRSKRFADQKVRDFKPTAKDPLLVVVIDEIATLTKYGTSTKAGRDAINNALGMLLSQGRAVGVAVVGALQDPRKDVLTMRDLFPTRISLRLTEPNAVDMLLGAGARGAGARADRIPVEHAGMGYMMVDGSPVPERFRASWVSDADIDQLVALCNRAPTPEPSRRRDRKPGFTLVDLDHIDGANILIELDGHETEVEVMAPPCESAEDEDLIEIDYRLRDGRVGMVQVGADAAIWKRTSASP